MAGTLSELNRSRGAVMGGNAGAPPLRYGDPEAEVAAIESGSAVLEREACGIVLLRGPDVAPFLNGLLTNNVAALPVGGVQPNLLCANRGKILYPVLAVHTKPEEYLLIAGPGELERVANHLDFYHIREDLQMGQAPLVRLDLLGPEAPRTLAHLGLEAASVKGRFAEGPLVTAPAPLGELSRVLALVPGPNAAAFVEALLGAEPPARLVGEEAYDEVRIRQRVPRYGVDYDRGFLPGQASLYDTLDFRKGCYVGQETHARMHYRGQPNVKLMGLDLPADAVAALGEERELFHEGRAVGSVTSLARWPVAGVRRAIGLVKYAAAAERRPIALRPDGEPVVRVGPLSTDLGYQPW